MGDRSRRLRTVLAPCAGWRATGLVTLRFRHRVTGLTRSGGVVNGVEGEVLEPSTVERGVASSRMVVSYSPCGRKR